MPFLITYMPKLQILHLGFNKIKNIDVLEKVYFPELIPVLYSFTNDRNFIQFSNKSFCVYNNTPKIFRTFYPRKFESHTNI